MRELVLKRERTSSEIIPKIGKLDYLHPPVSIKEFIENDYYLGGMLSSDRLFPRIKEDLIELFSGEYFEVLLTGAIGWGKTLFTDVGIFYDIYLVSCLKEPAQTFGLIPGSNVTFINVSARKTQAQKVMFEGLFNLVKNCPYVREHFPYEPNITTEIRFPNNINAFAVAASEQAVLGEGIFSAAFDEMNFMAVTDKSKLSPEGGSFDQASVVYNRLSRRIRSRMNQRGRLPGHLWLISSARYPADFTERKSREALTDKRIFVREYAAWETRPRSVYLPGNFKVEVGDVTRRTRVLEGDEDNVDTERVIEVPMDFKDEFDKDPDGCVRDYGGISILTIKPFIPRREKIQDMFIRAEKMGLKHAFSNFTVTLQDAREKLFPQYLHWVQKHDDHDQPMFDEKGKAIMMLAFGPYYAHVDLAKTQDAAGIGITHVAGSMRVSKGVGEDAHFETKPIHRVDLLLQIVAPKGGEIQLSSARGILYRLRDMGMQFGMVSYDGWQSTESVQTLKSEGFTSDVYSVDRTPDAYNECKEAIYDDRVLCPRNPILERELGALRIDEKKQMVDHPTPHGSKDVSDCLAGCIHHAEEGYSGGATSDWRESTTVQRGAPPPPPGINIGFESRQEEIEWKLMQGLPLTSQDIDDME